MGILLNSGDIIFRNNIRFRDNNKLDFRIHGHPFLLLNTITSQNSSGLFLKISSFYIPPYENAFYKLDKNSTKKKLNKDCFIDLRYIYIINLDYPERKWTRLKSNIIDDVIKEYISLQTIYKIDKLYNSKIKYSLIKEI